MSIYLDNAATTPLGEQAKNAMVAAMEVYGNPSSVHSFGRTGRSLVEQARRDVAKCLGCTPGELIFTGSGTEGNNTVLQAIVEELGIKRLISSPLEHHAVLYPVEALRSKGVEVVWLPVNAKGELDLLVLEQILSASNQPTLVSLMHGNNEIGNLLDLREIGGICSKYGALFHSDCVQTVGHFPFDLQNIPVDYITASGHKFHGPKGIGLLYVKKGRATKNLLLGGGQERGHRAGTENVVGIAGFAAALMDACSSMDQDKQHILSVKKYFITELQSRIPGVSFNGLSDNFDRSLYTVVNVLFPESPKASMLLFELDLAGIAASGGSACSSGALKGSHVLEALGHSNPKQAYVRFSFSKYTTINDVEQAVKALESILK